MPDDDEVGCEAVEGVEQFQFFCIGDPRIELVGHLIDPASVLLRDQVFLCLITKNKI